MEFIENGPEWSRNIIDKSPLGFALLAWTGSGEQPEDYRFVEVNQAFLACTGLQAQEVRGKTLKKINPPLHGEAFDWMGYLSRIRSENNPQIMFPVDRAGGGNLHVYGFSPRPGQMAIWFAETAEDNPEQTEWEYFFQTSLDCMAILDLSGVLQRVNAQWSDLLDYRADQLIGRKVKDLIHPDDQEKVETACARLSQEGQVSGVTARTLHRDGSYRVLELRCQVSGKRIDLEARDITRQVEERKQLDKLVAFSEILLQSRESLHLEELTDQLTELAGARFGACNIYEEDGLHFTTVHIAGASRLLKGASRVLGFELTGKRWPHDPNRSRKIAGAITTRFDELAELGEHVLDHMLLQQIQKAYGIGKVYVVKILKGRRMLGDFTFLMPRDGSFHNQEIIELYTRQLGLYLDRQQSEQTLREQRDQLRTIIDRVPHYIFLKYLDGTFLLVNQSIARSFGTTPEDMEGKKDSEFYYTPEAIAMFRRNEAEVIASGKTKVSSDQKMITKDGQTIWRQSTMIPYRYGESERPIILGISEDITERKKMMEEIRRTRDDFQMLLDQIPTHIWYLSDPETYGRVNQAHSAFLNMTKQQLQGKKMQDCCADRWSEQFIPHNRAAFDSGDRTITEEIIRDGQGVSHLFRVVRTPQKSPEGNVEAVICSAEDITVQKQLETSLEWLASRDDLTGIFNRRRYFQELEEAMVQARKGNTELAVLYLDFDDFKVINDSLGHEGGDRFLIDAVLRMKKMLSDEDIFARLGGDEFAILLPGADQSVATQRAREILNQLETGWSGDDLTGDISLSIGIALFPRDGVTPDGLMHKADMAMYQAKSAGKKRVQCFDPEGTEDLSEQHRGIERFRRRSGQSGTKT